MEFDQKRVAKDLVNALLAVNLWTVETVFSLEPGLERESLFDMDIVASMSQEEVFDRLMQAGYSRGDYITGLLAERLLSTAKALAGQGLSRLCTLLEQKDIEEIDAWLLSIRGVGPHVLKNFKMLVGLN